MEYIPFLNTYFGRPLTFNIESLDACIGHYKKTLYDNHKRRMQFATVLIELEKESRIVQEFKKIWEMKWVQERLPNCEPYPRLAFPNHSPHFLPESLISVICEQLPINLSFLNDLSKEHENRPYAINIGDDILADLDWKFLSVNIIVDNEKEILKYFERYLPFERFPKIEVPSKNRDIETIIQYYKDKKTVVADAEIKAQEELDLIFLSNEIEMHPATHLEKRPSSESNNVNLLVFEELNKSGSLAIPKNFWELLIFFRLEAASSKLRGELIMPHDSPEVLENFDVFKENKSHPLRLYDHQSIINFGEKFRGKKVLDVILNGESESLFWYINNLDHFLFDPRVFIVEKVIQEKRLIERNAMSKEDCGVIPLSYQTTFNHNLSKLKAYMKREDEERRFGREYLAMAWEEPNYDRDNFDALTDGQLGSFDDFIGSSDDVDIWSGRY